MSEQEIINALGQISGVLAKKNHPAACVLFLVMALMTGDADLMEEFHRVTHSFDERYQAMDKYFERALASVEDDSAPSQEKARMN